MVMNTVCIWISRISDKRTNCQQDNKQYCRLSSITKGDKIFRVHLSIVKYHEYVGIFHIIDNWVIQWQRFLVSGRRFHQVWFASMVVACKHSALEYTLDVIRVWWWVKILSWVCEPLCKIDSFAMCSRYTETHYSNIKFLVHRQWKHGAGDIWPPLVTALKHNISDFWITCLEYPACSNVCIGYTVLNLTK